jgi:hypothetical protein
MPYDWRMDPYKCIVCETRVQDCRCCDSGSPTLPFVVVIDGCGTFAGRYQFDALRYRDPDALPTGISYPATDPCGVFIGTISAGDGCSAGGTAWSGELKLMSWCDGTDAAIPWHVEVFCYNSDTSTWVSSGVATVTSYECRCDGPRFAFTLPDLDCCCDATLIETDCCPDGIPSTLTFAIESATCAEIDGVTATLTHDGIDSWRGETATITCPLLDDFTIEVRLFCDGTDWYIDFTGFYVFTALCTLVSCSPFEVTYLDDPGTFCSCLSTIRITE